jgi:hypothetical protein
MRSRKKTIWVFRMTLSLVAAAGLFKISTAFAFMLKFDGGVETPAALYASAPDGHLVRVLEAGASAPNGGTISEIGVPALEPDGSLIFGAEVRRRDEVSWQIFRADLGFGEAARIEPALNDSMMSPGCRPVLKTDPYAVAGSDGSIVFVAGDEYGSAALFRYVKGRIDCEMRVGDRTAEGHIIANLGFGSAQVGENGATVLHANLARSREAARRHETRNAILLALPGAPAREVAVEGDRTQDGKRYGTGFGLPAISSAGGSLLIAFINHQAHGSTLFVGPPHKLLRTLAIGSRTQAGPLTFLSDRRPSLSQDGSVAIRAASGERSMILLIRGGEPFLISREGDQTGDGQFLKGLGDPVRAASGSVFAEAIDQAEGHRVYSFSSDGSSARVSRIPTVLSSAIEVFPSSLAANRSGRYAFLARSREKDPLSAATRTGETSPVPGLGSSDE